jgi:hypothetical protein
MLRKSVLVVMIEFSGVQLHLVVGSPVVVWSTIDWSAITWLTILGVVSGVWCISAMVHCRAGHTSLSRVTTMVVGGVSSSHLRVASTLGSHVALPESELAATAALSGVVVGWARAVALLLLVVLDDHDLPCSSDQEEEDGEDGDGEDGGVQRADVAEVAGAGSCVVGTADTEGCVNNAAASICAVAGVVGDSSECACKQDVEQNSQEAEELVSCQAQAEDNAKDGVECCGTDKTLNCLLPCWDDVVVVRQDSQKVGVDSEADGSASELKDAQANEAEAKKSTADAHCVDVLLWVVEEGKRVLT